MTGKLQSVSKGGTFYLFGFKQRFALADVVIEEIGEVADIPKEKVQLFAADNRVDRYGRLPVHLFQKDQWLQGKLLSKGRALAYPTTAKLACQRALLDAETKNTAKRENYWRDKGVEIRATALDSLSEKLGHFVLVTGLVRSVGDRKRRLYLNFGENWAQDFTVSVAKQGAGKFKGSLNFLTKLKGKHVQVRGVLEDNRGPLIRVINEIQIQIIK